MKLKEKIRNIALKAFKMSDKKTQEMLNKMFPNYNLQKTQDISSIRKGVPTKFNPPTKSRRTKASRRK